MEVREQRVWEISRVVHQERIVALLDEVALAQAVAPKKEGVVFNLICFF